MLLLFIVLNAVGYGLIRFNAQGHAVENSRIYLSLKKARNDQSSSEIFVFGDSVANQMYPPETCNAKINSLALLMPSTMAGQYFLVKRFLEENDVSGKQVVLVISPNGLASDLNHDSSFHYVFKPFYNTEFVPWEDSYFASRIESPLLCSLSQLPIIKCSNWNPPKWINYVNQTESNEVVSNLSFTYLRKIMELVKDSGASFQLLPTVQRLSKSNQSYDLLKAAIETNGLPDLFQQYFSRMVFLKDDLFADQAHLRDRSVLGEDILKLAN